MKIKLSDIAKEMGISVAAVSMAINNKKGVSYETREQVLEVAERLGYEIKKQNIEEFQKSKGFIKLLRIKKHGLVVMETAFFASMIDGIEEECRKMGYELLISNIIFDEEDTEQIKREYNENVIGLLTLSTELNDEDLHKLLSVECPQVIMDREFDDSINTVLMNNELASRQAIEFLYKKGHRNIGYFKSSTAIFNFDARYKSYVESMEKHDLEVDDNYIIKLEPTIEGAYRDMKKYLEEDKINLPTAFLADNDNIALGAINALKEKGIKIPEEVSIIGIDDMPFCKLVSPQLSTIKIFKKEIGRQAVKTLIEDIDGDSEYTKKIQINTILIDRESVLDLNNRLN